MGLVNNFRIGCDPEFVLLDASKESCLPTNLPWTGTIGRDAGGIELRPRPNLSAVLLVNTLRRAICSRKLNSADMFTWKAGGIGGTQPIGGHIHFEKRYAKALKKKSCQHGRYCDEHFVVVPLLDRLTSTLEHLDVLPRTECAARRKHGYGQKGDIRIDHRNTFEYRSMCSWLFHPAVAATCLTLAKLVVASIEIADDKLQDAGEYTTLRDFVDRFKTSDDDALFLWERFFSKNDLRLLQFNPKENFRPKWQEWRTR